MGIKQSNPRACNLVSVYNPGVCCFVYLSYLSSGRFGETGRNQIVVLEKYLSGLLLFLNSSH